MPYDKNATIPVSEVRQMLRRIINEGDYLKQTNGAWRFENETPFNGLTSQTSYETEDEAVDAILSLYFPRLYSQAA